MIGEEQKLNTLQNKFKWLYRVVIGIWGNKFNHWVSILLMDLHSNSRKSLGYLEMINFYGLFFDYVINLFFLVTTTYFLKIVILIILSYYVM